MEQALSLGAYAKESKYFWLTISPLNQRALNVAKKLEWKQTHEFDDAMLEEGGEFFAIFEKENPYYEKERGVHR